jgi:preprotein translocase subunit SecD
VAADGERLQTFTSSHIGKKMAISVDEEIVSVPLIEGAVGAKGLMTMPSEEQARRLAASLSGGPLLAPMTFLREQTLPAVR